MFVLSACFLFIMVIVRSSGFILFIWFICDQSDSEHTASPTDCDCKYTRREHEINLFSLCIQEIVCNSRSVTVLSCAKSISPVHNDKTIKLTQEGRCSPMCCQENEAQRQGEGECLGCSSKALHFPGEQTDPCLFLPFSRLCIWKPGRRSRNPDIMYLLFYHHPLFPLRPENKQHQQHAKRLKFWFPRDGEQQQPVFTLLVRWTAVASAALLLPDPPALPDWTLPAPQQQLISLSAPRQQQRRPPQPPEERSAP